MWVHHSVPLPGPTTILTIAQLLLRWPRAMLRKSDSEKMGWASFTGSSQYLFESSIIAIGDILPNWILWATLLLHREWIYSSVDFT